MSRAARFFAPVLLGLAGMPALAGPIDIPYSFTANTPAIAGEVNANFLVVEAGVNSNAYDIAGLLQTVSQLQATVTALQNQVAALQSSSVMALSPYLSMTSFPDPNQPGTSYPTAVFSGINVQINNGTGVSQSLNGLGNLVIGYNEVAPDAAESCSIGDFDNEVDCEAGGWVWARNHRSGSHNLVVGISHAYSNWGGLVSGAYNTINGGYSAVLGGFMNRAGGTMTTVTGGLSNVATSLGTLVGGGYENLASHYQAAVVGGSNNVASGIGASVCGGTLNLATGDHASVVAGQSNVASGNYSAVGGGRDNLASGVYSSLSGGYDNEASGQYSAIGGGYMRSVSGPYNWRAGSLFESF